jgi:hypothetical protein
MEKTSFIKCVLCEKIITNDKYKECSVCDIKYCIDCLNKQSDELFEEFDENLIPYRCECYNCENIICNRCANYCCEYCKGLSCYKHTHHWYDLTYCNDIECKVEHAYCKSKDYDIDIDDPKFKVIRESFHDELNNKIKKLENQNKLLLEQNEELKEQNLKLRLMPGDLYKEAKAHFEELSLNNKVN